MTIWLTLKTAPESFITLDEAKSHLRVDNDAEDTFIEFQKEAAIARIDGWNGLCGFAIKPQEWTLRLPCAPVSVKIPLGPVSEITEIKYFDENNAIQSANIADFDLFFERDGALVKPKSGSSWPKLFNRPDALAISFSAGSNVVHPTIKQAALILLSYYFDNREAVGEIPKTVYSLIEQVRRGGI